MNQKSYDGSHTILGIIEFLAWASVIIGSVLALLSIGNSRAPFGVFIWAGLAFASIGLAALCRVGKAILDIAENTGRSSRAAQSGGANHTPAGPKHPDAPLQEEVSQRGWPLGQIEIYRGHIITGLADRVFSNDRYFDSVEEAKIHLNSVPAKAR
jgi:hypothetical protein